jgi:hypothetical protein
LFIPAEPKVEPISRPQKYFRLLGAHPPKTRRRAAAWPVEMVVAHWKVFYLVTSSTLVWMVVPE